MGGVKTIGSAWIFAALVPAALVGVVGCGEKSYDQEDPLKVIMPWSTQFDIAEDIPKTKILTEPKVKGFIRKSEANRTIDGLAYQGVLIEETETKTFEAPGTLVFEIVARRLKTPEPHVDIHVRSERNFRFSIGDFFGGRLVDPATGRLIGMNHLYGKGTYHLKAYK